MTLQDNKSAVAQREITRELASYAVQARYDTLPRDITNAAEQAFMNWLGCVFGGCRETAIDAAIATAVEMGGNPDAGIIGRKGVRTNIANAAFINCISSAITAYDDTHLATVTHGTGPVAAPLFALSEKQSISGEDFVAALAVGMEIECRVANALALAPAKIHPGLPMTSMCGAIGGAIALGRVLKFDEKQMVWAIGIAASQGSGFLQTQGTMTSHFRPGHAARSGVWAAMLVKNGFESSAHPLEGVKGFFQVFARDADPARAVERLGSHYELLSVAFKPYPCGIVVHPIIDVSLDVRSQLPAGSTIKDVKLRVHPKALLLTGVRKPTNALESHVSIYHWSATALLGKPVGITATEKASLEDAATVELRDRIQATADETVGADEAFAEVTTSDGRTFKGHIEHARGSIERPMTDGELADKFRGQVNAFLPKDKTEHLMQRARAVGSTKDVGKEIGGLLQGIG